MSDFDYNADNPHGYDKVVKERGEKPIESQLTRAGPGDNAAPGDYDTTQWWTKVSEETAEYAKDPNSIISRAKNKDIWFCTIPWGQLYTEMGGHYQACCFAQPDGTNIETTSLKDWMEKSESLNKIRREMITPGSDLKQVEFTCQRCRDDERRYGRSRRTTCAKMHTNDPTYWDAIQRSVQMFDVTDEYVIEERILEIQLKVWGSECNLDCHMCIHKNSTKRWDMVKRKDVWNDKVWGDIEQVQREVEWAMKDRTKGVVEQIIELGPYIRSVKIIGGEPLIMKKQYELLDALIKHGHAKHIQVKYQTNFTKMTHGKHSMFDYIPHFFRVLFVASVDGIGKDIEYLRRRTEWPDIQKNIDLLAEYPNARVSFNGLVDMISVLRFYKVIEYCKNNPKVFEINWAMIERPEHLRVNNLPDTIKNDLLPKYEGFPDIQAALRMPQEPDCDIQNSFDYLLLQDQAYVGTKWESHLFEVFPELEDYYIPPEQRNHYDTE